MQANLSQLKRDLTVGTEVTIYGKTTDTVWIVSYVNAGYVIFKRYLTEEEFQENMSKRQYVVKCDYNGWYVNRTYKFPKARDIEVNAGVYEFCRPNTNDPYLAFSFN